MVMATVFAALLLVTVSRPFVAAQVRYTTGGCECEQSWIGESVYGSDVEINNYCGNPDGDIGGEWCFTVTNFCNYEAIGESGHAWGYCRSLMTPRRRRSATPRRRRTASVAQASEVAEDPKSAVEPCPVMEIEGFPSDQDQCNGKFEADGLVWKGDDGVRWYYSGGDWNCDDNSDSTKVFAYITRESSGLTEGTESFPAKYASRSNDWRSSTVKMTCSQEVEPEWYHYVIGVLVLMCCCGGAWWACRRNRSHAHGKEAPSVVATAAPASAVTVGVASAVPVPAAAVPAPVASAV